jgi:hypothetical protein
MTNASLRTVLLALACALAAAGCTSTQQVPHTGDDENARSEALADLEAASREGVVTVETVAGRRRRARNVRLRADTLFWLRAPERASQRTIVDSVRAVEWKRHGRGAVEGLGLGVLGGLLGGTAAGFGLRYFADYAIRDEGASDGIPIALGAVAGGLVFVGVTLDGIITGTVRGHTTRYVFNKRKKKP